MIVKKSRRIQRERVAKRRVGLLGLGHGMRIFASRWLRPVPCVMPIRAARPKKMAGRLLVNRRLSNRSADHILTALTDDSRVARFQNYHK